MWKGLSRGSGERLPSFFGGGRCWGAVRVRWSCWLVLCSTVQCQTDTRGLVTA